jgi:hypothetical protein
VPQPSVEQEIPGLSTKVGLELFLSLVRRSERMEKVSVLFLLRSLAGQKNNYALCSEFLDSIPDYPISIRLFFFIMSPLSER